MNLRSRPSYSQANGFPFSTTVAEREPPVNRYRHKDQRVLAKVEHHVGELFPPVGFNVTNLPLSNRAGVRFYNKRGTVEQWIKEDKLATHWTRLSCHRLRATEVRFQLSVLAYNLGNGLAMAGQQRLVKTGGR